MDAKSLVRDILRESIDAKEKFLSSDKNVSIVARAAEAIAEAYDHGRKVVVFGNGGSAADSQHMAAELVVRFEKERRALPCICLASDCSAITATGNDYDFSRIFSRQIEAFGEEGDVAVAISTSGKSPNIIEAVRSAKNRKMVTIALTGGTGGELAGMCDMPIVVPSRVTGRIQEVHSAVIHIICKIVEEMAGDVHR
ncbi:MAG: SIS domain-containing protein [Candidatus Omnitrophica bacterium]|nr:SIS domain-containing protein [Candidatus Omnitrophota bacterium]MDD5487342.1 SIS domain-containing protein [Candidatus Omnitrophota bacterium]